MECTFKASEASVRPITDFILSSMRKSHINEKLCEEYELLFEELATKLVLCADSDAEITVKPFKKRGKFSVIIKCPGKPVSLEKESKSDYSGQILEEFGEYLRQSYNFGVNEIAFSTSSSSNSTLFKNIVSLLLAVTCGLLLRLFCSEAQLLWVEDNIISPVMLIFIRALKTVAVPVAFFSLVSFVIVVRRTFEQGATIIRLVIRYFLSSLAAIGIGVLVWFIFRGAVSGFNFSNYKITENDFMGSTIKNFLEQLVSENLIEPFISSNPIPVLVNALLMGFAASMMFGKMGKTVHNLISSINSLFSRMMNIIYGTIPYFLFFAVLDYVALVGFKAVLPFGIVFGSMLLAMLLLVVFYSLRLLTAGINPIRFFIGYSDVFLTNLTIASNIDAFPYNKRILARKTSLSRDFLYEGLKLGTLFNMDGNSLVLTVGIMELITAVGIEMTVTKYIGLAIILLLFSFGSPNQPGSFMLGTLIMMSYLGISSELIAVIIVVEALLSKLYSFLNSAGDIVSIAIEDKKFQRSKSGEKI